MHCGRYSNDRTSWTTVRRVEAASNRQVLRFHKVITARYFRIFWANTHTCTAEFQAFCGTPLVHTLGTVQCTDPECSVTMDFADTTQLQLRGTVRGSRVTVKSGDVLSVANIDVSSRG